MLSALDLLACFRSVCLKPHFSGKLPFEWTPNTTGNTLSFFNMPHLYLISFTKQKIEKKEDREGNQSPRSKWILQILSCPGTPCSEFKFLLSMYITQIVTYLLPCGHPKCREVVKTRFFCLFSSLRKTIAAAWGRLFQVCQRNPDCFFFL